MDNEQWVHIKEYPTYLISNQGRIYNTRTESVMAVSRTLQGDHKVTLSSSGDRTTRSVRVLVAEAFIPRPFSGPSFHKSAIPDTVIVLDNNQDNVASYNLAWRPRWFAHKYARQFKQEHPSTYFNQPIQNLTSKATYNSIVDAAIREGLLFNDVFKSASTGISVCPGNSTFIWT